jgi:hypothetical protein
MKGRLFYWGWVGGGLHPDVLHLALPWWRFRLGAAGLAAAGFLRRTSCHASDHIAFYRAHLRQSSARPPLTRPSA